MYYVLIIILGIIVYTVLFKLLKSVIKGCLTTVFLIILVYVVWVFVKSAKAPVEVFGLYKIDNLKIERINR